MKRPPGRIVVELDDLASAMVRKRLAEKDHPDSRDVVSAAVTFYLCDPDKSHGLFDLSDGKEALERAKRQRLHLHRKSFKVVRKRKETK